VHRSPSGSEALPMIADQGSHVVAPIALQRVPTQHPWRDQGAPSSYPTEGSISCGRPRPTDPREQLRPSRTSAQRHQRCSPPGSGTWVPGGTIPQHHDSRRVGTPRRPAATPDCPHRTGVAQGLPAPRHPADRHGPRPRRRAPARADMSCGRTRAEGAMARGASSHRLRRCAAPSPPPAPPLSARCPTGTCKVWKRASGLGGTPGPRSA
jgi:hypothetical protein